MTSKQEKLAAARRKLKEFQGKNKEGDLSKQKIITDIGSIKYSKDSTHASNNLFQSPSPIPDGTGNVKHGQIIPHGPDVDEKNLSEENVERKMSLSSEYCSPKPWLEGRSSISSDISGEIERNNEEPIPFRNSSDFSNGLGVKEINSEFHNKKNSLKHNLSYSDVPRGTESPPQLFEGNYEFTKSKSIEAKEFFKNEHCNRSPVGDLIKPLQVELQNHAQTITILVQQRNEAQTALAQTQNLVAIKSGEVEELTQKISFLTSSINYLNKRLSEAEDAIKIVNAEKEESVKKWSESKSQAEKLQIDYNSKEEELLELKKKYEDKMGECQRLLFNLQESQSQLALSQIQIQQFSVEGHSALVVQVSELQNENLNLKQKIIDLERQLEIESVEKEQSSQKFHVYAQQCNSQLSSLNLQVNTLKMENEKLTNENSLLSKNMFDVESVKEKNLPLQSFEDEIADLHNQVSALTEENNQLQSILKKKEDEHMHCQTQFEERDLELKALSEVIRGLEEDNKKLLAEAETPKANERLLATMESDKVAAAKAVSQNQKLKEQIVELEKAFMKVSQEKLELTDQLDHEKHVNLELQNLLKNGNAQHHDHNSHDKCHHDKSEPLVNDSYEIEELRNIVRQLQDDKIELKARLSSYELNKMYPSTEGRSKKTECEHEHEHDHDHHYHHEHEHRHEHDHVENETECENTKLILKQMEEKVRKTMDKIAALNEEKEKLEHLVLQLQGETETIGEYITLYQKQRMVLKQRALEKDNQLQQLSKDKEELKSKLASLDELVQRLIAERENINLQTGSESLNSQPDITDNTAIKIRALINEIGSTTLINNHSVAFEHCSCCSGRLITI